MSLDEFECILLTSYVDSHSNWHVQVKTIMHYDTLFSFWKIVVGAIWLRNLTMMGYFFEDRTAVWLRNFTVMGSFQMVILRWDIFDKEDRGMSTLWCLFSSFGWLWILYNEWICRIFVPWTLALVFKLRSRIFASLMFSCIYC